MLKRASLLFPDFLSASLLSLCCLAGPLCGVGRGETTDYFVTADAVNLRAAPLETAEVVGQMSRGDRLAGQGVREGDWLAVTPPWHVSLYVHRELISEGRVTVARLRVRGGPGIAYAPVGTIERGDVVTVRSEKGDWLEIDPPPGSQLWVNRLYVAERPLGDGGEGLADIPVIDVPAAVPESPAPTPVVAGPQAPALPAPVAEAVVVAPPAAPAETVTSDLSATPVSPPVTPRVERPWPMPPTVGVLPAGEAVPPSSPWGSSSPRLAAPVEGGGGVFEGVLRPTGVGLWQQPSRYRLIVYGASGRAVTLCYVLGEETELAAKIGYRVRVVGNPVVVQGVRHPVVRASRVEVLGR